MAGEEEAGFDVMPEPDERLTDDVEERRKHYHKVRKPQRKRSRWTR